MNSLVICFTFSALLSLALVQCHYRDASARGLQEMEMLKGKMYAEDALEKMENIQAALAHNDAMSLLQQSTLYGKVASVMGSIKEMQGHPMDQQKMKMIKEEISTIKEKSKEVRMSTDENAIDTFWAKVDYFVDTLDSAVADVSMESDVMPTTFFSAFVSQFVHLNNEVNNDPKLQAVFGDSLGQTLKDIYAVVESIATDNEGENSMTNLEDHKVEQDFFETFLFSKIRFYGSVLRTILKTKTTTTTTPAL